MRIPQQMSGHWNKAGWNKNVLVWFFRPTLIVVICFLLALAVSFPLSQHRIDELDRSIEEVRFLPDGWSPICWITCKVAQTVRKSFTNIRKPGCLFRLPSSSFGCPSPSYKGFCQWSASDSRISSRTGVRSFQLVKVADRSAGRSATIDGAIGD